LPTGRRKGRSHSPSVPFGNDAGLLDRVSRVDGPGKPALFGATPRIEQAPFHQANLVRSTVIEQAGKLCSKEWPPACTERSLTPTVWRSKLLVEPELSPETS
jgi:hypothetical protein